MCQESLALAVSTAWAEPGFSVVQTPGPDPGDRGGPATCVNTPFTGDAGAEGLTALGQVKSMPA